MRENILEIKNLNTRFFTQEGYVNAVNDFNLTVSPGEIVGIVGESGCGKSTTSLSIMRLLPKAGSIKSGEILLNGTDLTKISEGEMRRRRGPDVAMIFQDSLAALNPTMKVGYQLIEPLMLHMKMGKKKAWEKGIDLLGKVGIPSPKDRMDSYAHEFSGGMRQRVMIAMALSCDPLLLLADEPTTALDVTIQHQILELMLKLRDETGAGIIFVTHDVGVVSEICDKVIVMYAGRIVEKGKTKDVFENPIHPYTKGLLESTLNLTSSRSEELVAVKGMPPDLINLPPGCSFWPRCQYAIEECKRKTYELNEIEEGHFCSCLERK
jgi:oligopeptide transport system ATP-binding protein